MPITKSAKKALRQSLRRRARNLQKMRKLKNLLKEVKNLVSQKKVKEDKSSFPPSLSRGESSAIEEARKLLPRVYKLLDKAAKTGLIKKNTASRKKSRITKLISKSQQ
ncbi:MAG: 30S ribosomal protein S20 [Candidatus Nealsonbacteria bacterium CG_4_8_14_3_um_filter_37_36]|uniref:Small ribosomal subunit protein bS20 n=1 Tax=Candidatus Nealsonbacteria bacterium CG_4_8_14_3_um_filter_37_36 TaxID=1974688 RepID=A0A2H9N2Q4_9BACT|nr:MAG: 30S ribosomal protein S20 [Candidatus Nealsonbacteria bacterium CG_4_8_14_3_um_filter_37_36]